jgi:hypothetical protein
MTKTWSLGKIVVVTALSHFVFASACYLYGQTTGIPQGITGVVTDPSAAVVPGATVTIQNVETGVKLTTKTNPRGYFSFHFLAVGTYNVTVSAKGFKTFVRENTHLIAGVTPSVAIHLTLGSAAERVTVSGAPPLDLTSTTTGETLTEHEIATLPIEVSGGFRNAFALVEGFGGVQYSQYSVGYSIINGTGDTGGFGTTTGVYIDGVSDVIDQSSTMGGQPLNGIGGESTPIAEDVQEMRLETNTNAEYGWDMGSTLNVVLKSGTNQYHGSVYDYFTNAGLNARDWLATSRSPDTQNDYGITVGGPIRKNKDFFFFNWRKYSEVIVNTGSELTVPTAAEQNGDFSQFLGSQIGTNIQGQPVYQGEIYNPATTQPDGQGGYTRQPFVGNIIPQADFSPISEFFAKNYPAPNLPGLADNWVGVGAGEHQSTTGYLAKVDHIITPNQRISAEWEYRPVTPTACSGGSGEPGANVGFGPDLFECFYDSEKLTMVRANYTWTPGPTVVFDANFGVNYESDSDIANSPVLTAGEQSGLKGLYDPDLPTVGFSGLGSVNNFGATPHTARYEIGSVPVTADVTWIRGTHQMKFGVDYLLDTTLSEADDFGAGDWGFGFGQTALPDFVPPASDTTGNAFASFLLGESSGASMDSPIDERVSNSAWGFYAQDKWQATHKLTVNYGLRWDVFLSPVEEHDRFGDFCTTCPNPAAGDIPGAITVWGTGPGENGRTRAFDTDPTALGPRLGLAYAIDPKTVVRAYYGIQRYPANSAFVGGEWTDSYGSSAALSTPTPAYTDAVVADWDTFAFTHPTLPNVNPSYLNGDSLSYFNPKADKPAVGQDLGFQVQRELPGGWIVSAKYEGKFTHGLPTNNLENLNEDPLADIRYGTAVLESQVGSALADAAGIKSPYPGFSGPVYQALRPYPQYQSILNIWDLGKQVLYNAGIFEAEKHFGGGALVLANFTWSKTLTNDPWVDNSEEDTTGGPFLEQASSSQLSPGNSLALGVLPGEGGNQPLTFNLSYAYPLPFGPGQKFLHSQNRVIRGLVGGWTFSGMLHYNSGTPFYMYASQGEGPELQLANRTIDIVPGVPQITPGVSCGDYTMGNPSLDQYLNSAAFKNPPNYQLGNGYFVDPQTMTCGYANYDFSLHKSIHFTERISMDIGTDWFNAFNGHQWQGLNATDWGLPGFGQYTGTSGPRNIQLSAHISF